ncbi:MAG: lipid A export permease/ATP-binding protein MsbA [Gammaproteobacteria bacterium]|nr:lipid A export permease/ATP-binding protein MsbA [Gammaproteobacteria bacterium]
MQQGRTQTLTSKDLYLRLLQHVRPYWRQFTVGIVFIVLLALTEPAIPYLLKPLLDGTFVERDPEFLLWSPVVLLALFMIRGFCTLASQAAFAWVSGRLVFDLRSLMFERILDLPTAYFDATSTGTMINKVTHNVTQVTSAATKVLMVLVRDSVVVIGLVAYLLYLNWRFSLLVFVLLPVLVLAVRLIAKRLRVLSRSIQSSMGDITHVLGEAVRGHKVIKVFGGQAAERERFVRSANWIRRYQFKTKIADSASEPLVEFIAAVMIAVLIYVGTGQLGHEPMSVGAFVSFLAALGLLFPPIKRLVGINQPLQAGLAGAESVFELIDQSPENDTGTRVLDQVRGELRLEGVTFRYAGAGENALRDVSFTIAPGTTTALVGASGSGKTTIAALVPRFYDVTEGRVLLDGMDVRELTLASLRRQISYVGQESVLFNDTVAANIGYGTAGGASREALEEAARAAYALDFINELPQGFDTEVGEDGVLLSGGQRQRIAIARALLKDAPVLILDEATSALDTESERHVQAALQNLTRNRTTLVIAHRLSTIVHADQILVINRGEVVERGTHEELLALGGQYSLLYKTQFNQANSDA